MGVALLFYNAEVEGVVKLSISTSLIRTVSEVACCIKVAGYVFRIFMSRNHMCIYERESAGKHCHTGSERLYLQDL